MITVLLGEREEHNHCPPEGERERNMITVLLGDREEHDHCPPGGQRGTNRQTSVMVRVLNTARRLFAVRDAGFIGIRLHILSYLVTMVHVRQLNKMCNEWNG